MYRWVILFTLLYPALALHVLLLYQDTVVVVAVVAFHIQRIGCRPEKTTLHGVQSRSSSAEQGKKEKRKSLAAQPPQYIYLIYIYIYFFFHLTYSRWTSSLPSCLWSQRIFLSLPGSRLTIFYRDASSALLQLVNQWLNFTYSRSQAFRYERKNTNPTLVRIELTTSVLADVQLTY